MTKRRISLIFVVIIILILFGCIFTPYTYGDYHSEGMVKEKKITIYQIGNNNITQEIKESDVDLYIDDTYKWSIEPTTLMYSPDGWSSWIWNSEIKMYESKGWSLYPIKNITMNAFVKTNIPAAELEKMLIKGLSGYGQAFYNMEQKYGVNSVFAISVAELESGNGTSSAFRRKNNAFGIGPGWSFDSVEAGIDYFGKLMKSSLYCGKSIDRIGSIYCVGGNWAYKVKALMKDNYAFLGY